jgi:hypothetical protein
VGGSGEGLRGMAIGMHEINTLPRRGESEGLEIRSPGTGLSVERFAAPKSEIFSHGSNSRGKNKRLRHRDRVGS